MAVEEVDAVAAEVDEAEEDGDAAHEVAEVCGVVVVAPGARPAEIEGVGLEVWRADHAHRAGPAIARPHSARRDRARDQVIP